MNSRNVWLRWVREGSAYTITKSRRQVVRRERLRLASIFGDYATYIIKQRLDTGFDRTLRFFSWCFSEYNIQTDEGFCFGLSDLCKTKDEEEVCEYRVYLALDIISRVALYDAPNADREKCREVIIKKMKRLQEQTPYAGAIVRRVFKEIETKLIREAAR